MYTIYKLSADELNNDFLLALKTLFKNKQIEITVSETDSNEEDETAYLLSNPANRERLMVSLENIAKQQNLVTVDMASLQ
jgi:antitoxin YefM